MRNRLAEVQASLKRARASWARLTMREQRATIRARQERREDDRQEREKRAVRLEEKELSRRKREIRDRERELGLQRRPRFKRILGDDDDD